MKVNVYHFPQKINRGNLAILHVFTEHWKVVAAVLLILHSQFFS